MTGTVSPPRSRQRPEGRSRACLHGGVDEPRVAAGRQAAGRNVHVSLARPEVERPHALHLEHEVVVRRTGNGAPADVVALGSGRARRSGGGRTRRARCDGVRDLCHDQRAEQGGQRHHAGDGRDAERSATARSSALLRTLPSRSRLAPGRGRSRRSRIALLLAAAARAARRGAESRRPGGGPPRSPTTS